MEQQDALRHLTVEQKWETVNTERAKAKGTGHRRGSTGGIGDEQYSLVSYHTGVVPELTLLTTSQCRAKKK